MLRDDEKVFGFLVIVGHQSPLHILLFPTKVPVTKGMMKEEKKKRTNDRTNELTHEQLVSIEYSGAAGWKNIGTFVFEVY